MIGPSGAVRVMLATLPVDFRKGMDGLPSARLPFELRSRGPQACFTMLVREQLGADPFCGTVF